MSNPHNLKVGQSVWIVPPHFGNDLVEYKLTKVGRKYAETNIGHKIEIERFPLSASFLAHVNRVYTYPTQRNDEATAQAMWGEIRHRVWGVYDLDKLNRIKSILEEEKP